MAKERPTDPAEAFRELVTQWERGFDSIANQLMGTEGFSRNMNRAQDLRLTVRKAISDFMADQLDTFNMPSRDDVIRVAEALHALDRRVARVESLLAETHQVETIPKPPGPPRTKRPPSAGKQEHSGTSKGKSKEAS